MNSKLGMFFVFGTLTVLPFLGLTAFKFVGRRSVCRSVCDDVNDFVYERVNNNISNSSICSVRVIEGDDCGNDGDGGLDIILEGLIDGVRRGRVLKLYLQYPLEMK